MYDESTPSEDGLISVGTQSPRRQLSDEEKVRLVEESLDCGVVETARRHGVGRSSLSRWRRQYRESSLSGSGAQPQFVPVVASDPGPSNGEPKDLGNPAGGENEGQKADIELVNGRKLSVAVTIDPALLLRLLTALEPS